MAFLGIPWKAGLLLRWLAAQEMTY